MKTPGTSRPVASARLAAGQWLLVLFTGIVLAGGLINLAAPQHASAAQVKPAKQHHVVILIDSDDQRIMGHAISYSLNLKRAYDEKHEAVEIEIVANGSGIALFRDDTSPLQQPLAALHRMMPDIVFSMCDSSRQIAQEREGHSIGLIPGARLVPFGIGRVTELEEAGWAYIHG